MNCQLASPNDSRQSGGLLQNLGCLTTFALLLVSSSLHAAERTTNNVGNDLVRSLADAGRFDDAEWVCRNSLSNVNTGQLSHSRWSARLAEVLAERNVLELFKGRSSDLSERIAPAMDAACRPIDAVLASYPNSPGTDFLAASKLGIRQRILRAAIVAASVSPPNEQLTSRLLSQVSRLQIDTQDLQKTARDRWSKLGTRPELAATKTEPISAAEYNRLFQQLSIQRISLAILQTELFDPKTADYRSAASAAVSLAKQAILALPDSAPAKQTATVFLAESLLRSGDNATANELIQRIAVDPVAVRSPVWTAIRVRYQLAIGKTTEAQRLCEFFYSSPNSIQQTPARSIEMDFAKLDVLLADQAGDGQVASWLDVIERHGGAFARRRAEAIAIGSLRSGALTSKGSPKRGVSPALIAAQGEDFLRRNDPSQAATFLREAALAESVANTAFVYAAKSAAAAIAATEFESAVEVLQATARKHLSDSKASDLMMQAALIASKPFPPTDDVKKRVALLEDILREISQTWPQRDVAVKTNAWLCRFLVQTNRVDDAAQASVELLSLGRRPDQLGPAMTLAFESLSQMDSERLTLELNSLSGTLSEITDETPSLAEPIRRVAIWLLDRHSLSDQSPNLNGDDDATEFLRQLARFRISGEGSLETSGLDQVLLRRARWRLERDAMSDASLQQPIGRVLAKWSGSTEWQTAMAQLWTLQDQASIESIKRLAVTGNHQPSPLRRGMKLLAASQSPEAKLAAIELSDRLASTMKTKTKPWYETKLQAMVWLKQIGQADQAMKRAKYLLLLHPPSDSGLRKQFEAFAGD